MIDKGHCMMNTDDFEEEFEPFYDFSGTYEENFVGKTLEDFDLSEEQVASNSQTEVKPQIESIKEQDDEWEDIDLEDGNEEHKEQSSDYSLISKPKSSSEFTLLNNEKLENLSDFDKERLHAIEQISTHLNEKEA